MTDETAAKHCAHCGMTREKHPDGVHWSEAHDFAEPTRYLGKRHPIAPDWSCGLVFIGDEGMEVMCIQKPHAPPCGKTAAKPPAAETLTPMARAWLERFTPESWEGFPGYEPEVATAIRQALATIDAAQREVAELRAAFAGNASEAVQLARAWVAWMEADLFMWRKEGHAYIGGYKKRVEAANEGLRAVIALDERVAALEAALAKARRAIGEAAIPLEALRATEINGKALSPAVQAAIINATEAIRDALPALAGLPGASK